MRGLDRNFLSRRLCPPVALISDQHLIDRLQIDVLITDQSASDRLWSLVPDQLAGSLSTDWSPHWSTGHQINRLVTFRSTGDPSVDRNLIDLSPTDRQVQSRFPTTLDFRSSSYFFFPASWTRFFFLKTGRGCVLMSRCDQSVWRTGNKNQLYSLKDHKYKTHLKRVLSK